MPLASGLAIARSPFWMETSPCGSGSVLTLTTINSSEHCEPSRLTSRLSGPA